MSKFKASKSNVKWDQSNRSVTDDEAAEAQNGVTDDEAAEALAASHPKSTPPSIQPLANVLPGSPGSGAAPGANSNEPYPAPGSRGAPVTGAVGPGGPLGSY